MTYDDVIVQWMDCQPSLPTGFQGWYERHINVRTGDAHTCLSILRFNTRGKQVYVRSFHGPYTHDCDAEFVDWLCAELCRQSS